MTNFVIETSTPERTAMYFQAVLGADKGHASTRRKDGADVIVESDGKTVRFTKKKAS